MTVLWAHSALRGRNLWRATSVFRQFTRGYATHSEELKRTGLYDFHVEHGAKMVPYAGYSMPLVYGDVGQVASHNYVRNNVGIFDVGHMVQSK